VVGLSPFERKARIVAAKNGIEYGYGPSSTPLAWQIERVTG